MDAPDAPTYVTIGFEKGVPVSVDGAKMKGSDIVRKLNELGGKNGIGLLDIVENRLVGMLCFLTTDCAISSEMIKAALLDTVGVSFNRISVDGDTSTNDTCCVLANGLAGNETITQKDEAYGEFLEALQTLAIALAKSMAGDGEGAKHLITCTVKGATDENAAETVCKSVISSTLTKAAIFGADANWGRVLCAMGRTLPTKSGFSTFLRSSGAR